MTDSNLVRVLQRQSKHDVGLINYEVVVRGSSAIKESAASMLDRGYRHAIVDAVDSSQITVIADVGLGDVLLTGASPIGGALARKIGEASMLRQSSSARVESEGLHPLILAGSCSPATLAQVEFIRRRIESKRLDPTAVVTQPAHSGRLAEWSLSRLADGPVLIYSSATPKSVAHSQLLHGTEETSRGIEKAFASIAIQLVGAGVRHLILAGGETAGAVVSALEISALDILGQIDTGVPWTVSVDEPHLAVALKSGSFGKPEFFRRALATKP